MSEDSEAAGSSDRQNERSDETMTESETDNGRANREASTRDSEEGRDLRRTLNYVLLAGLSLLALIATLQLYFNVSSAINQWISREYRSLFQAAFNLVVLLLVGSAMVWQVRRLRE